ncbi:PEP-CTERM sorting domain-containing protein [Cerasicoccus frondis]
MIIAVVPEPGTWALFAGAIALGLVVWQRRG